MPELANAALPCTGKSPIIGFLAQLTDTMQKRFISADELLQQSFELAINIYRSGYRPDFIVGVWRGGAPVGIAVQEMLHYLGIETDHIAIRTSSYTGIGERDKNVRVHGLSYIVKRVKAGDAVLVVDDVYDTGLSIQAVIQALHERCGEQCPDIKVATPYYKPGNNQTRSRPDFYLYETEQWLVFPHELMGLPLAELAANKPALQGLTEQLQALLADTH